MMETLKQPEAEIAPSIIPPGGDQIAQTSPTTSSEDDSSFALEELELPASSDLQASKISSLELLKLSNGNTVRSAEKLTNGGSKNDIARSASSPAFEKSSSKLENERFSMEEQMEKPREMKAEDPSETELPTMSCIKVESSDEERSQDEGPSTVQETTIIAVDAIKSEQEEYVNNVNKEEKQEIENKDDIQFMNKEAATTLTGLKIVDDYESEEEPAVDELEPITEENSLDIKEECKSPWTDQKVDERISSAAETEVEAWSGQGEPQEQLEEATVKLVLPTKEEEESIEMNAFAADNTEDVAVPVERQEEEQDVIKREMDFLELSQEHSQEECQSEAAELPEAAESYEDAGDTPPSRVQPSPFCRVDDLSPVSLPEEDDDEMDLVMAEPAAPTKTSPETIKIESDSDVEELSNALEEKFKAVQEQRPTIKLNGAHGMEGQAHLAEHKIEVDEEEDKDEKMSEKTLQQSVIANDDDDNDDDVGDEDDVGYGDDVGDDDHDVEQTVTEQTVTEQPVTEQHQTSSRRNSCSSRSSSISSISSTSSTSQQLVIDQHPEMEMSQKQQLTEGNDVDQHHPVTVEEQQPAMKRRRSSDSNRSANNPIPAEDAVNPSKRSCEQESPLLMQRLQAELPKAEEASTITTLAPAAAIPAPQPVQLQAKGSFFRCTPCGTVYEPWSFFQHMRQTHQRFVCLYCANVFGSVEKLSLHLENRHDMDQQHFTNADAWQAPQAKQDRPSRLICCTCEAMFKDVRQFEQHDCAELMKSCALCGQKGTHSNECRNGSAHRKKLVVRQKRRSIKKKRPFTPSSPAKPMTEEKQLPPPAPPPEQISIPASPEIDATPKLVVPKMMLRVPKEFQKSVDVALSSTESEDEDVDEVPANSSPACQLLTVDAVHQQQQELEPLPAAITNHSEDTETATETASYVENSAATAMPAMENPEQQQQDDEEEKELESPSDRLTRLIAEYEMTKWRIEQHKLQLLTKKQQEEQPEQQQQLEEQRQQEEQQQVANQQQRRWSPTPPASPHINPQISKEQLQQQLEPPQPPPAEPSTEQPPEMSTSRRNTMGSDCMDIDDSLTEQVHLETEQPIAVVEKEEEEEEQQDPAPPADGIMVASEQTPTIELQLERPLDKFSLVEFVRLCLKSVCHVCLYCNHARRIAVNAKQLVLHLIGHHRYSATVDSITAEELYPETIVARLKSFLSALEEQEHYLNGDSYCTLEEPTEGEAVENPQPAFNERVYECFQCRYVAATHKELYSHNRRLHVKTNNTCSMCQLNYFSYSELLSHICPGDGATASTTDIYNVQFRCCLCKTPPLPSAFRLMVHLRKKHQTCDICLEDCHTQAKLSSHVWKHKLLHLCYRCGIAYRNKQDISKHLFWKHGTEGTTCKRCLQKRWRHVYHFCIPATEYTCEICLYSFSKAIYLEVHRRQHAGDFRYACAEEECEEKFVSRKLLLKHAKVHEPPAEEEPEKELEKGKAKEEVKSEMEADTVQLKTEAEAVKVEEDEEQEERAHAAGHVTPSQVDPCKSPALETPRKRRKKSKRNKASLEDLNLIAPNLSESDSSDDSDSAEDAAGGSNCMLPMRPPARIDDLDMPNVMLSPATESDTDEPTAGEKQEEVIKGESQLKPEESKQNDAVTPAKEADDPTKDETQAETEASDAQEVPDIWKNLLPELANKIDKPEPSEEAMVEQVRPQKLHVTYSDHDYCKMIQTPPPSPKRAAKATPKKSKIKRSGGHASSGSDSSSSSSSDSDSDSSSCSCGSNCSCSSSSSSSSDDDDDDDSDNESRSSQKAKAKAKLDASFQSEEDINVTTVAEEDPTPQAPSAARLATPPPKAPTYNESDYDTAISDTDEEFYDAHPQKMASELLAEKRRALLAAHSDNPHNTGNNYDIVENSRPSTPSLPEEAAAFEAKRERLSKTKKKKRERKSTSKSGGQVKPTLPQLRSPPQHLNPPQIMPQQLLATPVAPVAVASDLQVTPLTHHPVASWQPRISEGSSCSDADGQLKRSKRTRRPNKFYGYTSDDENMSCMLAPSLQVGMQLIKPQPPPQLTWAKEDLPSPVKQQPSRSRSHNAGGGVEGSAGHTHHRHSNGNSSRKRTKRTLQSGGGAKRSAKRAKIQSKHMAEQQPLEATLPPIPTLKIRPGLLTSSVATATDSSGNSSDDDDDINVTSLVPAAAAGPPRPNPAAGPSLLQQMMPASVLPPPQLVEAVPPPATTAFNQPIPPALLPNPDFATLQYFKVNNIRYPIRPPAGARLAREGESVYCYCRCPYDEVSEMIACDGSKCLIEWFHFECVGIMVAPQGKWFCAECRPKFSEGLYPGQVKAAK